MFVILNGEKTYDFSKGNLTVEYIKDHVATEAFKTRAQETLDKKNDEGLTIENVQTHPVYKILPAKLKKRKQFEGKMDQLTHQITLHSLQFKGNVILLAKTFGIKRFITDNDKIWNACCLMAITPLVILIAVMFIEVQMTKRKKNQEIDSEKKNK